MGDGPGDDTGAIARADTRLSGRDEAATDAVAVAEAGDVADAVGAERPGAKRVAVSGLEGGTNLAARAFPENSKEAEDGSDAKSSPKFEAAVLVVVTGAAAELVPVYWQELVESLALELVESLAPVYWQELVESLAPELVESLAPVPRQKLALRLMPVPRQKLALRLMPVQIQNLDPRPATVQQPKLA
eukprot:gene9549-11313_t